MSRGKNKIVGLFLLMLSILWGLSGCDGPASGDTPKETVIMFFGAMERNDKAAIIHLIDLPEMMNKSMDDYALQTDKPRIFHSPDEILNDLTDPGTTKNRWFAMQRVIGKSDEIGDSATVEVSFINKQTNTQYYTKFGLHKARGTWKIYSFRKLN